MNAIAKLLHNLPPDEAAYYEDEVDIHLNPKIGPDWMVCGQQKEVATPGKNEKKYLAGAQSVRDKELVWVEGELYSDNYFSGLTTIRIPGWAEGVDYCKPPWEGGLR